MNLETYYDDPTTPSAPQTVTPSPVQKVAPPSTPSPVSPLVSPAIKAVFTEADLAGEGVTPDASRSTVTGCLASLPPVDSADLLRRSDWKYTSGSVLTHEVAAYPAKEGTAVLAEAKCPGQPLTVAALTGVDAHRAWCEGSTCTVLMAKGHFVSGVRVTASTPARASEAAKRLAKVAAAKLVAVQES